MSRKRLAISLVVVAGLIAFWVGIWMNVHYEIPNPNDPAVARQAAEAAALMERHVADQTAGATSARCTARLLDRDGDAYLVHAACRSVPGPTQVSGPFRVETAGDVRSARAGEEFDEDVRQMFGRRLGDWYLNHRDSFSGVKPPADTPSASPIR